MGFCFEGGVVVDVVVVAAELIMERVVDTALLLS